ncbi:MAG: chitobiase/beta-hexosaminidase C-terminal domain-containing protein, partial [Nitrososphaera sp.]
MQSQRVYHGRSFYYRNVMIFALAAILLLGLVFSPLQYASALLPGACNCVIFRLDDIQDWWLNSVQNAVMDNFITKQEKVSLGIVMNFVGNDASVVNKVRTGHSQGYFELVSHGWNHVDYSALSLQDQQNTLGQANQKMSSLWGRSTYIFIPPYNTFNNDTQKALQNLGMKVLSSEFDLLAPYVQSNQVFKSQTGSNIKDSFGLYELPQQVGFYNYDFDPPHKNSIDTIMNQVTNRINSHGYAVVTLHPQDFAVKDSKQVPLNQVSSAEIADLNTLITNIHSAGFSIKSYTQVSGIPLPPIVDNTPPVLTPPADKTVISSQPITTVNLGTPTVTDNVDPSPIVTNNAPAAGFPQGTTAVVWNATDHTGNTRLATQYVTIRSSADNIKPLITTTSPPSGTISGPASGLNIRVTGTASDAETGIKIVEVRTNTLAYAIANKTSPDSWSNWSKVLRFTSPTSTTIVARATDFWGNQQWSNTPITVTLSGPDTTPPQVTAPPNITTEATSAETPVYTGTATAFDNSDPAPVISSNGPGSGESAGFPLGTTVITWTARDAAGNVGTATQTITIVDTTAPAVPDPLLPVNGTHSSGGPVNFDWSDEVDAVSNVKYDLLVANNTAFNSPIVQQTGLVNSTYTSTALPSGTYFWKVRSADASGNHSPYSNTLTFTVDSSAPTVTASPSSGTYNSTQSVSLTASEPSTIYYTTNGSTPTTSSTVYSTPISISNSTTLKFFAVDTANNASPVV